MRFAFAAVACPSPEDTSKVMFYSLAPLRPVGLGRRVLSVERRRVSVEPMLEPRGSGRGCRLSESVNRKPKGTWKHGFHPRQITHDSSKELRVGTAPAGPSQILALKLTFLDGTSDGLFPS